MKEVKTYCDLCGKTIEKGYGVDKGVMKLVGRASVGSTRTSRILWEDLCHGCSAELFSLLYRFAETKKGK